MANYKETLLIGKTDFEMRAGLGTKEPIIEQQWQNQHIYEQKMALNHDKQLFMLHDGPPYANGDLHIGHALNKSLKDFIIRWKNANGFLAPFIMGWDTHGLPIETAVTKTGVNRKEMSVEAFRKLCEEYALNQVTNQSKQFLRLGVFSDPQTNYLTLNPDYELSELRLFQQMYHQGLIYRALKPIYWSPSSESALAESEVEYHDIKSPTVYVSVDVKGHHEKLIIWTTTPWTLPMNQLIAVGENLTYVVVQAGANEYIVAKDLLENVREALGWNVIKVLKEMQGSELVGWEYHHPVYPKKFGKVVVGHHVTSEAGTGIVHIASGFGEDDYLIAKNNGLEIFAPMDDQGRITGAINDPELVGQFYEDTNKIVTQRLAANKHLLKLNFMKHSYPHDWRTKKPVIYRATLQWFIGLDKAKAQILEHVNQTKTFPKWAKSRLYQVLNDRRDWTISRQRVWGVPIIGFYDQNNELVLNGEILDYAIQQIGKLGINAWFKNPADDFLPSAYQHQNLRKEKDILDVWFDSGSSAIALEKRFPNFNRPFDLYLEGNDQYRGWFNASMINSVVYDNKAAYKMLVSHGMTTDEQGKKMSKSLGNGIDPMEFANSQGSDVLRLWVASTDFSADQKIGPEIIKQVSESYRKIRNTIRFILANLFDYDPTKKPKVQNGVNKFVLHQLTVFKNKVIEGFNNYKFNEVYNALVNYVTKDLSAFYLDFIKDIVYVEAQKSTRRLEVQAVLYEILWALIDSLRPIMPHTVEEIYQAMSFEPNKAQSVHLLDNREQNFLLSNDELTLWTEVMELRDEALKALEIIREQKVINKNFEAELTIEVGEASKAIKEIDDLATIFIVSKINFVNQIDESLVSGKIGKIKANLRQGVKCDRCWGIYDSTVGETHLCQRCYDVVSAIGQGVLNG